MQYVGYALDKNVVYDFFLRFVRNVRKKLGVKVHPDTGRHWRGTLWSLEPSNNTSRAILAKHSVLNIYTHVLMCTCVRVCVCVRACEPVDHVL